ncbi:MAG: transketolase [Anaerolineaceae bacterium]|nr:MAG: transketolase [Anaerolineaceae bacterium]
MIQTSEDLQKLAINTIRTLSIDAVQQANSGHPGLPMGAAAMAYTLWQYHLRHNPRNPAWPNRDRFVLSAGHGSMLIYSLLHLAGYDLSLDELKNFRQWGSKTPGHPERHDAPGVEMTTGPLGQGGASAVGMALAEAYLARLFNRPGHEIVDHFTYALVSDGDLMEGVCMEASALAGHWKLGKLIFLYDSNDITLDGEAQMTFTEDIAARYGAWGWHVLHVADGNDTTAIDDAIRTAQATADQPSIIIIKTVIGYGSPNKAGTSKAHGSPLGAEEIQQTKAYYGWPDEAFHVPDAALDHWREAVTRGAAQESRWEADFNAWAAAHPDLAALWRRVWAGELPDDWDADLPLTFAAGDSIATRSASGKALNAIAAHIPTMIGGDADLAGSTSTLLSGNPSTGPGQPAERNLRFGVREHGMGAIVNGLALHGGITRPYSATFLAFSDYMRPAVRLGALMRLPVAYVFTHDSIGLGEDGPTHQPVEHVMSLRTIPNLYVFRPADANETAAAWVTAMSLKSPVAFAFTRQNLPVLDHAEHVQSGVAHGAYTLADCEGTPHVILMATGSEVHIALEAHAALMADGVKSRVVSMPCWELFDAQDATYKESVLPSHVTARISIEAGVTLGWQKYTGSSGVNFGVDRFGASAPYQTIYEHFGLTAANVAAAAHRLLSN